jgi:hypothetical protein
MKTLVGGPDDFDNKKPQNKFEKAKPGSDYQAHSVKEPMDSHLMQSNYPSVKPKTTRSMQFHTSVAKAKNPHENSPKLNWEHKP